ncbi:MAG: hypothetical protein IJA51_01905 [Oscillospiraceae bacterium]|nr:hypothetical protein [Oscillospiraceae bacterium]
MKVYTKPVMVALSLAGNEQLCGSCAEKGAVILLRNDSALAQQFDWLVGDGDGVAELSDIANVFGTKETGCSRKLDGYCKFTSSDTMVAWS